MLSAAAIGSIGMRRNELEKHRRASRYRNEAIRQAAARATRKSSALHDPAVIASKAVVWTARQQYLESVNRLYPLWLIQTQTRSEMDAARSLQRSAEAFGSRERAVSRTLDTRVATKEVRRPPARPAAVG